MRMIKIVMVLWCIVCISSGYVVSSYKLSSKEAISDNIEITGQDRKNNQLFQRKKRKAIHFDVGTKAPQMIHLEGYLPETHIVQTEDGYVLEVHRITGAPGSPTVLLQHGLICSSDSWLITGKKKSLAFMLADLGYDVWLGNARGTNYCRNHIKYTTSDSEFWDFSWHEMGVYDLPAITTHIMNIKKGKIMFIGHSMGSTMFYVMASERPEFISKFSVVVSLGPVAFLDNIRSPLSLLAPFLPILEPTVNLFGLTELLPDNALINFLTKHTCDVGLIGAKFCSTLLFIINGFDASQFDDNLMPLILPGGSSTKTLFHYLHVIANSRFQQYDYGSWINLKRYNRETPPDYDLSKMQIPVAIFWGENDWMTNEANIKKLYDNLPNPILLKKINYKKFNHIDFLWAIDAPTLLYNDVISIIQKYS